MSKTKQNWILTRGINLYDVMPARRYAINNALDTVEKTCFSKGICMWIDFNNSGFMIGIEKDPEPFVTFPVFDRYPDITKSQIRSLCESITKSMMHAFSKEDLHNLYNIATEGLIQKLEETNEERPDKNAK